MKKILFLLLAVILTVNGVGCAKAAKDEEQTKISIRGQITAVLTNDSKAVTAVMVEGKLESDTVYDKARVAIDKGTKILKGSTGEKLAAGDLKEGMKVEAVFEGPVAESYPVQAKAGTIRVID